MPKSLAEYLGTSVPAVNGQPERAASDAQVPDNVDGKEFAEAVVNSREFFQYIVNGLTLGDLAPAVVCRLMDHAWGKPVEVVQLDDRRFDKMSKRELEDRIAELRRDVQDLPEDDTDQPAATSVH